MDLQAITGQIYIVNGEIQQAAAETTSTACVPGLLAQSAPSKANRNRKRDFLFLHLTLTGSSAETAVLAQEIVTATSQKYYETGGSVTSALRQAVSDADVIYTDTWTSMGQEEEAAKRENVFPPYQVNAQLVSEADKDVIVMHCLPAHRNHELTDEVADGPHSVIFPQAHNRLHAQKAILARLLEVA